MRNILHGSGSKESPEWGFSPSSITCQCEQTSSSTEAQQTTPKMENTEICNGKNQILEEKNYAHCNCSSHFFSCWHGFNQHHICLHSFGILWTFEQKAIKAEMRGQMKSLYFIVIVVNWCIIITLIIEPKSGLENRFPFSSDKIKLILAFIWFRLARPVSFRRPCKRW